MNITSSVCASLAQKGLGKGVLLMRERLGLWVVRRGCLFTSPFCCRRPILVAILYPLVTHDVVIPRRHALLHQTINIVFIFQWDSNQRGLDLKLETVPTELFRIVLPVVFLMEFLIRHVLSVICYYNVI